MRLSITLIILLMTTSMIFADDEILPVIEYHICHGISDRIVLEDELHHIIEHLLVTFESEEILINFTDAGSLLACEQNLEDSLATFIFYEDINSEGIIDARNIIIQLSDKNLSAISPVLGNDLSIPVSIADTNLQKLLETFILYSIGDISDARDNLLELKEATNDKTIQTIIDYYLGNIALVEQDIELTLEYYNNQYWLSSPNFHTFYGANLAWVALQTGDFQKALEIMDDGVTQYQGFEHADYIEILVDRAQLYALAFDYTSAIQDMDTAIDHAKSNNYADEDIASLYKQRGDIIMLIYEWNRALEDYNTAIELDPDYAEAYYRRGILLYTMVEREDAIADFETYLELEPDGKFTELAQEYIDSIQTELDALGN